jgi:membrane-bound metal-dependent hydrolase YbcI (DUF457 family)
MRKPTHLLLGLAAAAPVALPLSTGGAAVALWFGMIGGALPDYLDLKAESKRVLRHRGASHGLTVVALCAAAVFFTLHTLAEATSNPLPVSSSHVWPWTIAFTAGMLSHLLSDACTVAGIRPLLPFAQWKFWLLPGFLRGRSSGPINAVADLLAVAILGVVLAFFLHNHGLTIRR